MSDFKITGCLNIFPPFHTVSPNEEKGDEIDLVVCGAQPLLNEIMCLREYATRLEKHLDGTGEIEGGPRRVMISMQLGLDRIDQMLLVDSRELLKEEKCP